VEHSPCLRCLPFSASSSLLRRLRFCGRCFSVSVSLFIRLAPSGELRRCVSPSRNRRNRDFASCSSFNLSEALWLLVSRMIFFRNFVFGLRAFVAGLIGVVSSGHMVHGRFSSPFRDQRLQAQSRVFDGSLFGIFGH